MAGSSKIAQKAIERATDPAKIHALLSSWEGETKEIVSLIATHAGVFDEPQVRLIADHGMVPLQALLRNLWRPKEKVQKTAIRAFLWN